MGDYPASSPLIITIGLIVVGLGFISVMIARALAKSAKSGAIKDKREITVVLDDKITNTLNVVIGRLNKFTGKEYTINDIINAMIHTLIANGNVITQRDILEEWVNPVDMNYFINKVNHLKAEEDDLETNGKPISAIEANSASIKNWNAGEDERKRQKEEADMRNRAEAAKILQKAYKMIREYMDRGENKIDPSWSNLFLGWGSVSEIVIKELESQGYKITWFHGEDYKTGIDWSNGVVTKPEFHL